MFSWHRDTLKPLLRQGDRLAHALLVQGAEGIGLAEFAAEWARCLLCEKPAGDGSACGQCMGCNWFDLGNHPDFRLVQPDSFAAEDGDAEPGEGKKSAEKKSDQIRIDQVRALQDFLGIGTHRAGRRVVVLYPADSMNIATQNALLKSLEEPPTATVFLLVTSNAHRLLPTVRSRCQAVTLPSPTPEASAEWLRGQGVAEPEKALALAGGAPLLAAEMAERSEFVRLFTEKLADRRMEPLALAAACASAAPAEFVAGLYRWCYDLLSVALAGRARYHHGREAALRDIATSCRPERIAGFLRTLAEARSLAQHPLNAKLFFEDLLLRYQALLEAPGKA
jgi:DNA polymerase-3 subunit delta'